MPIYKEWQLSLNAIHKDIDQFTFNDPLLEASGAPHKHIYHLLTDEITELEKIISSQLNENDVYEQLQTVPGIGKIFAATISLETGEVERFERVGNYASYCRCVKSTRISNNKIKGKGNEFARNLDNGCLMGDPVIFAPTPLPVQRSKNNWNLKQNPQ